MNINYHASFKLNFKKAEKDKTPHSEKHTLPFQPKVKQRHQILFFDLFENQTKQKHLL
jgi:hypothetical protein